MRGFAFPRLSAGCEAMRRVMQRGLRPSVLRLYDELDSWMAGRSAAADRKGAAPVTGEGAALEGWLAASAGELQRRAVPGLKRWLTGVILERTGLANRVIDAVAPRRGGGCLMVVGVEGDRGLAAAEWSAVARELSQAGGRDLGPGPGERWLKNRYAISFNM